MITKRPDGSVNYEEYKLNNKYHRIDGPAFIEYSTDSKIWYLSYWVNGQLHRLDGPAEISYHDNCETITYKSYYIFGHYIMEEEFNTPGFVDLFILEHS
jgi:hypothetical protein